MKLSAERKLFLGLRLDAAMKRQLDEGKIPGRPIYKAGDPAHLEVMEQQGEFYVGRIIEAGFAIDQLEDLKRNIRSIVSITFTDHKPSTSPRLSPTHHSQPHNTRPAAS